MKIGTQNIDSLSLGGGEIEKVMLGSTEVYTKVEPETWLFGEALASYEILTFSINFLSNNIPFDEIAMYLPPINPPVLFYGGTFVYDNRNHWTNQAYRTITLSTPATGDLLTFLQNNATKLEPNEGVFYYKTLEETVTVHIFELGMTWSEFINSEYNANSTTIFYEVGSYVSNNTIASNRSRQLYTDLIVKDGFYYQAYHTGGSN